MDITTAVHVTAHGKQQVGAESPRRFEEMFLSSPCTASHSDARAPLQSSSGTRRRKKRPRAVTNLSPPPEPQERVRAPHYGNRCLQEVNKRVKVKARHGSETKA